VEEEMDIRQDTLGVATALHLAGRLDANTAGQLEKTIVPLIEGGTKNIIVDFDELEYISSAGLRVLLLSAKLIKKAQGIIVLCGMKDFIKEIFDIAGFTPIFTIKEDCDAAKAQF
jgi:anti-sigma B factor antagonist